MSHDGRQYRPNPPGNVAVVGRSRLRRRPAIAVSLVVVAAASACSGGASRSASRVAVFYGDSILYETHSEVASALAAKGWTTTMRADPGFALCDLEPQLRRDLAALRPAIVVVETQGNFVRKCMSQPGTNTPWPLGSSQYVQLYDRALTTFVTETRRTGATVLFVTPLPVKTPKDNLSFLRVRQEEVALAASGPHVLVTDGPRDAVSNSGRFTSQLPCLPSEKSSPDCHDGRIRVRDSTIELHLCPKGYAGLEDELRGCRQYSSGIERYSRALVAAFVSAVDTLR